MVGDCPYRRRRWTEPVAGDVALLPSQPSTWCHFRRRLYDRGPGGYCRATNTSLPGETAETPKIDHYLRLSR